jgi:hypothetical protein
MNSKILHAAMFCIAPDGSWGLPVFLWGEPGVGKTFFVKDEADSSGMIYERLSPAERGEGQFGVCPVPQVDGFLHYPPPDWSKKFESGAGVIFVDELNRAPSALIAPLLGLVQLRVIGSHVFPARTRRIAASNEVAGGFDLPSDLANRFGHFDFEGLGASEWSVALSGGFKGLNDSVHVNADVEEKRVEAAWPAAIAFANGVVGGFIRKHPGMLHKRPPNSSANASKAWASRRSCEYAAVALASARVHGLNEIDTDAFMAGFVGLAWVTEFRTWTANLDLPEPADVLDGKVKWAHDGRRLDRTMVVLQACAGLVAPEKAEKKKERGNECWRLIASVLKDAADCAMPAARVLIGAKMCVPGQYPVFQAEIGHRLLPIMAMAGVMPK